MLACLRAPVLRTRCEPGCACDTYVCVRTHMPLLRRWERLLHERPLAMNCLQGAALAAVGDVVAHRLEAGASTALDRWQLCGAAASGAITNGVVTPVFYRWLDVVWPGTGLRAVASKSASDIVIQGGFVNAALLVARGEPVAEVRRDMPQVLLHDCYVWLPYTLIAYRMIPIHIRPTTTALMTLGWSTYLSAVAVRARAAAPEETCSHGGAPLTAVCEEDAAIDCSVDSGDGYGQSARGGGGNH